MKIAIRGGHNFQALGAKALLCETTENRKVRDAVIKYLRALGQDILDVTPSNMDSDSDLKFGVDKANRWGADIFISLHFNKAYDNYDGALGTECWILNKESKALSTATKIVSKISKTGLKNRGVKVKNFYELKYTKMPAIIVEICFVESKKDVEIYKSQGVDKFGLLIAEGILGEEINLEEKNEAFRVRINGKQVGAYSKVTSIIEVIENNFGVNLIEIEKIL